MLVRFRGVMLHEVGLLLTKLGLMTPLSLGLGEATANGSFPFRYSALSRLLA